MKTIIYTASAAKDLDAIPAGDRETIETALCEYAISGHGDVKSLTNRAGYRLRIGRYRVIFGEDRTRILAIYIGKRETATYKRN